MAGMIPILVSVSALISAHGAERPNVLIVMVDDMRFDQMSCAGHPCINTPNQDRLAKECARGPVFRVNVISSRLNEAESRCNP